MGGKRLNDKCMKPFSNCTKLKQNIGMLESQREVAMTILVYFGKTKPEKLLAFQRNVATDVKLDYKNHIFVKGTSKYCRCKHCDHSIYARNAMLSYTRLFQGVSFMKHKSHCIISYRKC